MIQHFQSTKSKPLDADIKPLEAKAAEDKKGKRAFGAPSVAAGTAVGKAYSVFRKATGSLGGDADGGAIYGEITINSFQKIIDVLKDKCKLGPQSRFIDIGSGLGKPNVHAAISPGVALSYGVELIDLRWQLSLHVLKRLLSHSDPEVATASTNTFFAQADICASRTLDPFTHVYMFDVGFPPDVMSHIAKAFNASQASQYLICFHNERTVVDTYGFEVDLLEKVSTSMSGSSEGHQAYIYTRKSIASDHQIDGEEKVRVPMVADASFQAGLAMLQEVRSSKSPATTYLRWIDKTLSACNEGGRTRGQRSRQKRGRKEEAPPGKPISDYFSSNKRSKGGK
jgi:hypothetical protein